MRPDLRLLTDELIETILGEARSILCGLGVEINNEPLLAMAAPLVDELPGNLQVEECVELIRLAGRFVDRAG